MSSTVTSAVKFTFTTLPLGDALFFLEPVVVFVESAVVFVDPASVPLEALEGGVVESVGESDPSVDISTKSLQFLEDN